MLKRLVLNGQFFALIQTDEIAAISQSIDKDVQYTVIILKNGQAITYLLPLEDVVKAIFGDSLDG